MDDVSSEEDEREPTKTRCEERVQNVQPLRTWQRRFLRRGGFEQGRSLPRGGYPPLLDNVRATKTSINLPKTSPKTSPAHNPPLRKNLRCLKTSASENLGIVSTDRNQIDNMDHLRNRAFLHRISGVEGCFRFAGR